MDYILVSATPAAGIQENLYPVPAGRKLDCRIICTSTSGSGVVSVALAPGGASHATAHFVMKDSPVADGEPISTAPLALPEGVVVRVQSDTGNVNFHLTGILN